MEPLLEERVAVVTGGMSGNGRAICRTFAEHGADVVVADVREEPREGGAPTHELVASETDADATFVHCDVTERGDLEAAMDAAAEFGGVDVMVNNAGIFRGEEFLSVTDEEFEQVLDVNVKGVFLGTQVAGRRMVEADGGAVVNLSSVAGLEGTGEYVSYCTSKGAVRLMTYATADALGPQGVRVNAIHPGVIETAMTTEDVPIVGSEQGEQFKATIPTRRFGDPGDVADCALFLASDLGDYVNGESLVVDGGMSSTG